MREIMFHGKRVNNGEWVEGYYVKKTDPLLGIEKHFIVKQEYGKYNILESFEFWYEVIPETVGQYTGKKDKNGVRIFEGHILRFFRDELQVVEWEEEWSNLALHTYGTIMTKKNGKFVKKQVEGWNWLDDYPLHETLILGNIHDNPELLEAISD